MKRTSPIATLAVLCLATFAFGCSGEAQQAEWKPDAAELMVFGTQIPLYPGAVADDAMGSDLYGETKEDHSKGMAIWFVAEGTYDELADWYEARLPEAALEETDDGYLVFTLTPEGGLPGECIGVIIEEDGKFRVFERVKANRSLS